MTKIFRSVIPIRELQREKTWSRIHLIPLLLAEGDRDAYRRQQAALAREKEIMKDVQGWEVGHHEPILGTVFASFLRFGLPFLERLRLYGAAIGAEAQQKL